MRFVNARHHNLVNHPFHFQKRNQLFMRVYKRNSSLACQAVALKDSHLSLFTSDHFLIL